MKFRPKPPPVAPNITSVCLTIRAGSPGNTGNDQFLQTTAFPVPASKTQDPGPRNRLEDRERRNVPDHVRRGADKSSREKPRAHCFHVALDVSEEEALIAGYRRKLRCGGVGVLFSAITGAFVTRKGLGPLKEITQATERITANQLHGRIVADGWPAELASLAQEF